MPTTLRPHPITSRVAFVIGIVVLLTGFYVISLPLTPSDDPVTDLRLIVFVLVLGIVVAGLGALLVFRQPRLRIDLFDDRAELVGMFGRHTVPRDRITGVTDWPSMIWTDDTGRERSTRVTALNITPNAAPKFHTHIDAQKTRLRAWAEGDPPDASGGVDAPSPE